MGEGFGAGRHMLGGVWEALGLGGICLGGGWEGGVEPDGNLGQPFPTQTGQRSGELTANSD